jgi:hypothetical protein
MTIKLVQGIEFFKREDKTMLRHFAIKGIIIPIDPNWKIAIAKTTMASFQAFAWDFSNGVLLPFQWVNLTANDCDAGKHPWSTVALTPPCY